MYIDYTASTKRLTLNWDFYIVLQTCVQHTDTRGERVRDEGRSRISSADRRFYRTSAVPDQVQTGRYMVEFPLCGDASTEPQHFISVQMGRDIVEFLLCNDAATIF